MIRDKNVEFADNIENDAKEQEQLLHICPSTINAKTAAITIRELCSVIVRLKKKNRRLAEKVKQLNDDLAVFKNVKLDLSHMESEGYRDKDGILVLPAEGYEEWDDLSQ